MDQSSKKKENFLPANLIIDDRFKIIEPVRKTIGCIVYRALDMQQDSYKALLIIPPLLKADLEAMEILKENAALLQTLSHPKIAGFYGIHTGQEYNYFEMEYAPGKSVRRKKTETQESQFTEYTVKHLALQILEGLEHAHNLNLLHRNIKPQKIILSDHQTVKLIDFGISDILRRAMSLVVNTSSLSAILFMPPEQIRGKNLSVQSDIYSLGATLYYMLDGNPPFYQGDIQYQILNEEPEPVEGVSGDMNNIILRCLSKDPAQRYHACGQLILDLQSLAEQPKKEGSEKLEPEAEPGEPSTVFEIHSDEETEHTEWIVNGEKPQTGGFFKNNKFIFLLSEKIKSSKPVLLWVGSFFIILLCVVSYKIFFSNGISSTSGYSANTNRDPETTQRMAAALNEAADKQYSDGRFIAPKGSNALELYLEVLKIDPDNRHASDQIQSMKDKLYDNAKNYLDNWMLVEANELIESSVQYFEDDERFKQLHEELEELFDRSDSLPIRIEILNGVGKSGIANALSKFLKNNNYKVVNTDNYRVSGMVNWQVKNSVFIGSIPENERIENLESLLKLTYNQDKLSHKQFKSANILLILGSDYQKIPVLSRR